MASTPRAHETREATTLEPVQLAAILASAVVVASMLSVEAGIAVALLELGLGVALGNVFSLHSQQCRDVVAAFPPIVLTSLAGWAVPPGLIPRPFRGSVRSAR